MKRKIELQLNLKTEYYALRDLLFVTIFWLPASFIFVTYIPSLLAFLAMVTCYMILFFIPTIYLHSNYEKYTKGRRLIIEDNFLIFQGKNINIQSIKSIDAFGTGYTLGLSYFGRLTHMTGYCYLEIKTNTNDKIILTSLLSKNIIKLISDNITHIEINLHPTFYPVIKP